MLSKLHLDSSNSVFSWKRIGHIDRPRRDDWDEMANVWKARAEWVDKNAMDTGDIFSAGADPPSGYTMGRPNSNREYDRVEKLIVGWGGTVWVINVLPAGTGTSGGVGERKIGSAEIATMSVTCYPPVKSIANKDIDYELTVLYLEFCYIPQICFSSWHM